MLTYWALLMIITQHPDAPPLSGGFRLPPVSRQVLQVFTTPNGCTQRIANDKLVSLHGKYDDTYFDCVVVQIPGR
jgi:hypothetical protein